MITGNVVPIHKFIIFDCLLCKVGVEVAKVTKRTIELPKFRSAERGSVAPFLKRKRNEKVQLTVRRMSFNFEGQ